MPRALPVPLREEIVRRRQAGHSARQLAQQFALPERTIRRLWQRYCTEGAAGLAPRYDRCARRGLRFATALYQAALQAKRAHCHWGAGLIHVWLAERFPGQALPRPRTLQTWFAAAGLQRARAQPPRVPRQRAQAGHEVWEVDAKEGVRLADGSGTSVLTVTDEGSGALLGVVVFPPVSVEASPRARGPSGPAGVVRPLGASPADPGGQWHALGHLGRSADGLGTVVGGLGH